MQKDKVRVYALARELQMESKDLLDLCQKAGIDVKNQLSSLDPEQRDQIEALVRKGSSVAVAAPPKPAVPTAPTPRVPNLAQGRVPTLNTARPASRPPEAPRAESAPTPEAPPVDPEPEPPAAEIPPTQPIPPAAIPTPAMPPAAAMARPAETAPISKPTEHSPERKPVSPTAIPPAAAVRPPEKPAPTAPPVPPPSAPLAPAAAASAPPAESAPRPPIDRSGKMPTLGGARPPSLNQPRGDGGPPRPSRNRLPRIGNVRFQAPPTPKPKPAEPAKPPQPTGPRKLADLPDEVKRGEKTISSVSELMKLNAAKTQVPTAPTDAPETGEEEDDGKDGRKPRPGAVPGRSDRHKQRQERGRLRPSKGRENETGILTADDDGRQRHRKLKRHQKAGPQPRKGKVPVYLPITVRVLSEAIGMRSGDVLFKLRDLGLPTTVTINSTIDPETALLIATDAGIELDIKRPQDAEELMITERDQPDDPADLVPRAPVVVIMGHVDHGKTSLLDRIRESNVVSTEAGGITQVIRAWRVEHGGKPITFLDTPGHEAFTKMRARGAHVTDIAVIVVAADDGVMPQTEEAIAHAKAAGVSIVVAINKIDLPNANLRKTEQQLYGLGLIPDNMGGDVPFVQTSAAKGTGVDLLLDTLAVVAELKELKANPKKAARGTCLEAMLSEGEGVIGTLLVRDGTLRRGDIVVCGATYGRVRALYNDLGHPIQEAGPSTPVRITGLDEVPDADDAFQTVEDLAVAREIAEKRKAKRLELSQFRRVPVSLERLADVKVDELKVILKADFRGSIEAIRKELDKLQHEEVRVRILHAATGGITESDVDLALASPEDTIIVGFNVVPDDRAKSLADERSVQVREYDIIYKLTDDIRAALEGKLKPEEKVVNLGRAVVRETFKISRVGTIAGCHVTMGIIERSSKVRLIREGVVVYPPSDRTVGLESVKRFKEDVREVKEGFECGLKIAGYDDIKVGDVIEAYRVDQVQRTLQEK